MKHGIRCEPLARKLYADSISNTITECGLIVAEKNDWLAYSTDGVIIRKGIPFALLEIKSPVDLEDTSVQTVAKKCKFLKKEKENLVLRKKKKILRSGTSWNGNFKFKNVPLCFLF